ncbi:MAG: hypothetical protein ACOCUT_03985 [bacterium]
MDIDLNNLLPDPNGDNYEKIKAEHPYNILLKYAHAIEAKYPTKLAGIVTESKDLTNNSILSYAFYITASIGTGYSYRLLELESTSGEIYPLSITIFEKHPQKLDVVSTPIELENALQGVLKSGFTHTLILNLLAQIDLYNESRKG